MNSNDLVISTEGLSKSFGEVHALKSLGLRVPQKSIFAFLAVAIRPLLLDGLDEPAELGEGPPLDLTHALPRAGSTSRRRAAPARR